MREYIVHKIGWETKFWEKSPMRQKIETTLQGRDRRGLRTC